MALVDCFMLDAVAYGSAVVIIPMRIILCKYGKIGSHFQVNVAM